MSPLVDRLLGEQLPDGGWNCEVERGATVSSFGTTINVLEGLLEHERAIGGSARGGRGTPPRRGVPARTPAVPAQVDGRGDRSHLARVLVSPLVFLRRPSRSRAPARRRRSSPTSASPRPSRSSRAIGRRRPMAAPERPRGRDPLRDGGGRGQARADGTRSERCACSIGTRRAGRPPAGRQSESALALGEPGEFLELTAEAALVGAAREDP